MNGLFETIVELIHRKDVMISFHGYEELANDNIYIKELLDSINSAKCIHEYPDYYKGPCILSLHFDRKGEPIHAVWGIPLNMDRPAVLVTGYRPDKNIWDKTFTRRQSNEKEENN
jgi:hypothetical protein